jgi:polysaccharide deacetylase family protein (PEP-CTERM system associated)
MSYCTLSIDWEDFGQLYGMYHYEKITEPVKGAIERQTSIMLDMLDETNNKATFFILGMLAQCRPELVKQIAVRGHEIAIHGQNHKAMFTLTPDEARKDLQESIDIVTNITGKKIYGYRAPFFSVNETNIYLLEILADLGLIYDSSIFPKKMSRYGIDGFSDKDALYELSNGTQLVELPLTIPGQYREEDISGYCRKC